MSLWNEPCIFSPSLICLDLCNLEAQVRELENSGCPMLHVDILDGYFSPSMPIGLDVVRQLRKKTNLPFDVHLMAREQDYFVEELLDIGVDQLVFHGECEPHLDNRLNMIHRHRPQAGYLPDHPGVCAGNVRYRAADADQSRLRRQRQGEASPLWRTQDPGATGYDPAAGAARED